MAVKYDKDTDYQALINEAAAKGDYAAAAKYEQQRNAKISDLNASGTNKYNAAQSTNYAQYLGSGYTPTGTHLDADMSAEDKALIDTYSKQYYNAISLGDRQTADAMHLAAETLRGEKYGYSGGGDGSEYIAGAAPEAVNPTVTPNLSYPTYDYNEAKPEFESSYSAQIDELLNQILNRDAFSYDAQSDPLYQQYLSQYNREGNRAMNDTLAAAASNAGGMNSYAVTAAQQANNYYAAQAADKIPELYQLAYQMYLDDIDLQVQDLGLLQGMDETQYGRYRDQMGDWRDDRDFAYNKYRDDVSDYQWDKSFDYNAYWDEKNFDYNVGRDEIEDSRYDTEWNYATGRDEVSDSRYDSENAYARAMELLASGAMPDDAMLTAAGLSKAQAQAILAAGGFSTGTVGGVSGTTGGATGGTGGGNIDNGSLSSEQIKQLQKALGVTADGLWGPASSNAAGGLSADDAWALYGVAMGDDDTPTAEPNETYNGTRPDNAVEDIWDRGESNANESEASVYSAMRQDLGLGAHSASFVAELVEYGGVYETSDGHFAWATGWTPKNCQQKLKEAKNK